MGLVISLSQEGRTFNFFGLPYLVLMTKLVIGEQSRVQATNTSFPKYVLGIFAVAPPSENT